MIKYWQGKFEFAISLLFQQGTYLLISLYNFQIHIISSCLKSQTKDNFKKKKQYTDLGDKDRFLSPFSGILQHIYWMYFPVRSCIMF